MDIKSITRTAAVIYADSMSKSTTSTIKRRFIESVFINNGNSLLTISELADNIENDMGLLFSEEEIKPIIKDDKIFAEVLNKSSDNIKYNLQEKRYQTLCTRPVNEIDNAIDAYFLSQLGESPKHTRDDFKKLIYSYLHSVLNTNIAAYSHFINPKKTAQIPRLNAEQFEDSDIDVINAFVKWDNEDKNKAIFKLINYCIEYAVIVNNSSEDILTKSLRTKVFYLDNSLLYRALGINGEIRKRRTLSFLKKCKDSGQKFVISKFTRQEFVNTVEFHLSQLNSSTPFGRITPKVFRKYSNGDGFYQFYHEWRNGRQNYGFDTFKAYIHSLYKDLINRFDIQEDFKVPYNENEEPLIISQYKDEIQAIKNTNRNEPHLMDARNMYWIECIRDRNNYDVASTKYYFVTSDQKLQCWDKAHSTNQPLTLLPSQWMGLILKYVSRSTDDYKSFISFMNIPKDNSIISENDLQSVMAGISEMTEDFTTQESIIASMMEVKFEDVLNGNVTENAKAFAKNKLEKDFEKQLEDKELEKQREKAELIHLHEQVVSQIQEEAKKLFAETEKERKKDKLKSVIKEIGSLENRKRNAENHAQDRWSRKKLSITLAVLLPVFIWIYIVYKYEWEAMEKYTYFPPIIYLIFCILYAMIYGKSFNPIDYIKMGKDKYLEEEYLKFGYSDSEYKELIELRNQLKELLGNT